MVSVRPVELNTEAASVGSMAMRGERQNPRATEPPPTPLKTPLLAPPVATSKTPSPPLHVVSAATPGAWRRRQAPGDAGTHRFRSVIMCPVV
jgi:hypothetical protein